jgi:hypothetical protein
MGRRMVSWVFTPEGRRWLYSVAVVALPFAAFYGGISQESIPVWMAVIAAVLGVAAPAMALGHISTGEPAECATIPDDLPAGGVLKVDER